MPLWELKLSAEVSLYTKVLDEPIRCLVVVLIVFCITNTAEILCDSAMMRERSGFSLEGRYCVALW